MNIKKYLENRIRGWLPKEPNIPSNTAKMNDTEKGISKWRHFWFLLIISCILLIVVQVSLYLLAYVDLFTFFGGVLVIILGILLSYTIWHIQTKYQHSKSVKLMNKIAYILAGALVAPAVTLFSFAFIALTTGWIVAEHIGTWGFIFIMCVVAPTIGASITYWIGKRRDFMPYV